MTEQMRWRMFAYMAALFIAGAICGAAVMHHMAAKQSLKVGRTDEISQLIMQKLDLNLELTAEQRQKIEPLVRKTSEEMEASHLACLDRICAAIVQLHDQIKPDLTPEQLPKLARMDVERQKMMREKYNYPLDATNAAKP